MKHKYTLHHLIPQSLDDWTGFTKEGINKQYIDDRLHVRHHSLMNNKSPVEQLIHVLLFNEQILDKKFVIELIKVLDKYIYSYYKVDAHIQSELGSLLDIEKEYFNSKKGNAKR